MFKREATRLELGELGVRIGPAGVAPFCFEGNFKVKLRPLGRGSSDSESESGSESTAQPTVTGTWPGIHRARGLQRWKPGTAGGQPRSLRDPLERL